MEKKIVIGIVYSDIRTKPMNRGHSAQLVYAQVTSRSKASLFSCIDWAYRNGATGIQVYPGEMIDFVPYLTDEQRDTFREQLVQE